METKKSKKPETNFNAFWPSMKAMAKNQGLNKGQWFRKSGVDYQRYSEFDNKERDISGKYFIKLIGGLNVMIEDAEKRLGGKFSEKQKRLLKFDARVEAQKDWLEIMLNDPETMKTCKAVTLAKKQ